MMKKQQIQLPDEIDKNQFLTAANLWEHQEDLDKIWNIYVSEGEKMLFDTFIYIMIKYRIIRSDEYTFTPQEINNLTADITDQFYKLQSDKDLQLQTFCGKISNMESELLVGIFNDMNKLRKLCEKIVHTQDNDGKMQMSGFIEIQMYIDPKCDKAKAMDEQAKMDMEKDRSSIVDQIFMKKKEHLRNAVQRELGLRKLIYFDRKY